MFYHYKMSLPRGAWPSLACLVYHLLARESLARNVQLLLVCFSGITDFEFYVCTRQIIFHSNGPTCSCQNALVIQMMMIGLKQRAMKERQFRLYSMMVFTAALTLFFVITSGETSGALDSFNMADSQFLIQRGKIQGRKNLVILEKGRKLYSLSHLSLEKSTAVHMCMKVCRAYKLI